MEIEDFSHNIANEVTMGFVDYVDRNVHQMGDAEFERLANSWM